MMTFPRGGLKTTAQILRVNDGPDISFDSVVLQNFGGVDGGDAQPDVTDIAVCGKIFVGKNYAHGDFLSVELDFRQRERTVKSKSALQTPSE